MKVLLSYTEIKRIIKELAFKIAEKSYNDLIIIGIQQGGVIVADLIYEALKNDFLKKEILYGQLDITFYRDDIRQKIIAPDVMNLPFSIENKIVILIDDVLFTGRTIKAALDALLDYGRPAKVELCVLIDRKEHRQFPIQADYTGETIKTAKEDKVKMMKNASGELEVILISEN